MTSYVTLSFRCLLPLHQPIINPFLSPSTSISFCLLYNNSSPRIYYCYTFFLLSHHYFVPPLLATSFQVQKSLLSTSLRISSIFSPLYFFSFPSCLLSPFPLSQVLLFLGNVYEDFSNELFSLLLKSEKRTQGVCSLVF